MADTNKKGAAGYMLKLCGILFIITAVVALLLGFVNYITADKIAAINEEKTAAAMSAVLPGEDSFTELDGQWDAPVTNVYAGAAGSGWVVKVSPNGFGGAINMVVGVGADSTVSGVSIIKMSETSGLGDNAKNESWREQFIGKSGQLAVTKDGGEIDALTGATVTSRAVTSGVNAALATVATINGTEIAAETGAAADAKEVA